MDDTMTVRGMIETGGPVARSRSAESAFALVLIAVVGAALLAGSTFLTGAAQASTIVSISGSGDLTVEAAGDVYLDFSQLSVTELTIIAGTSVVLDTAYPDFAPTVFDTSAVYADLMGTQSFDFPDGGDVLFDSLVWTGTFTVIAGNIYGIGDIGVTGGGGSSGSGGACPPGTTSGSGVVVFGAASGSTTTICAPEDIIIGGGVIVPAVPEPSSAVLVAWGIVVLLMRRDSKSHS